MLLKLKNPIFKLLEPKVYFSGTVRLASGEVVSRPIRFYKSTTLVGTTSSDSSGRFSKTLSQSPLGKYTVICEGVSGENSAIYKDV